MIFNRVEPPLKARLNTLSLALSWPLWSCLCCTHVILLGVEPRLKAKENIEDKICRIFNIVFLEEATITKKLVVYEPNNSAISWSSLPVLTVTLSPGESNISPGNLQVNYLSIVVESIYNPSSFLTESTDNKAATIVYLDDEVNYFPRIPAQSNVIFCAI